MAGDRIDIYGKSYYFENNTSQTNYNVPVLDILSGLLGTPTGTTALKGVSASQLNGISTVTSLINSFLSDPNRNNDGTLSTPRAYINWILFDENFNKVKSNFDRVGAANVVKPHVLPDISVTKNGFLYVYVNNESPVNVFFDNLQVIHTRGPILEETHYYPFGLTMVGISSKSAGGIKNKKKYNGIEFNNDLDLNIYEAFYRNLDPQTGRWWNVDPKADEMYMWSTYASNFDNPIRYEDYLGDEGEDCCGELLKTLADAGDKIMLSASGTLWGSLNTLSAGLISTDPFKVRPRLDTEQKMYWDNAVNVGRIAPLIVPVPGGKGVVEPVLEVVPVGGAPKGNVKIEPVQPGVPIPAKVNATHTKNARPSTKQVHQKGQARKKQNREGSKGMVNPPRIKPPGHKGPWPPKPAVPKPPVPKPPSPNPTVPSSGT